MPVICCRMPTTSPMNSTAAQLRRPQVAQPGIALARLVRQRGGHLGELALGEGLAMRARQDAARRVESPVHGEPARTLRNEEQREHVAAPPASAPMPSIQRQFDSARCSCSSQSNWKFSRRMMSRLLAEARKMPNTRNNWLMVTMRPRSAGGEISAMYMGAATSTEPTPSPLSRRATISME